MSLPIFALMYFPLPADRVCNVTRFSASPDANRVSQSNVLRIVRISLVQRSKTPCGPYDAEV